MFAAAALTAIPADYRPLTLFILTFAALRGLQEVVPGLNDPVAPKFEWQRLSLLAVSMACVMIALFALTDVRIRLWRREQARRHDLLGALAGALEAKEMAEAEARRAANLLTKAQEAGAQSHRGGRIRQDRSRPRPRRRTGSGRDPRAREARGGNGRAGAACGP